MAENGDQFYHNIRLSKLLAYMLRYAAEKEGLRVREGGWVALPELMKTPQMRFNSTYAVLKEVAHSKTDRGVSRYEHKVEGSVDYVRALYGRRMEPMAENGDQFYHNIRLSKLLAYMLRYAAEKEGLQVREGGWVALPELMKTPQMRFNSTYAVLKEVAHSKTDRGVSRYEHKVEGSVDYVRALYARRMERNIYHENTRVVRLMESCLEYTVSHLDLYDLSDFQDQYIIKTMIHKLRKTKRLTNRALKALLVPCIESLDLSACHLVESTVKQLPRLCPALRVLNLRDCGNVITDHVFVQLIQGLQCIESLNVANCHHLTDRSLDAICKHCNKHPTGCSKHKHPVDEYAKYPVEGSKHPVECLTHIPETEHNEKPLRKQLQHLNISYIPSFTREGILCLLTQGPVSLKHVELTQTLTFDEEGLNILRTISKERGLTVVLDEEILEPPSLEDSSDCVQNG